MFPIPLQRPRPMEVLASALSPGVHGFLVSRAGVCVDRTGAGGKGTLAQ